MLNTFLKQPTIVTVLLGLCTLVCLSGAARSQDNPPSPQKFDQFADIGADAAQARLDQLALQLQQDPTVLGYLIGYRQEEGLPGTFLRTLYGYREYLVKQRGVPAERVTVVEGGIKLKTAFELWLVTKNSNPPFAATAVTSEVASPVHFDSIWLGDGCVGDYMLPLQEPADALKFFADALRNNPTAKGYILVHAASRDRINKAVKLAADSKGSLVRQDRIDANRILTELAGRRHCSAIDLWLAPMDQVDAKTASVALFFQSQLIAQAESDQYTIVRVEFIGNEHIRDQVLRRRIPGLQEGEIFTREILKRNLASLSRLPGIKPVGLADIEVRIDRKAKLINLNVFVNERRRGHRSARVG